MLMAWGGNAGEAIVQRTLRPGSVRSSLGDTGTIVSSAVVPVAMGADLSVSGG
jgi:hypothetical protein